MDTYFRYPYQIEHFKVISKSRPTSHNTYIASTRKVQQGILNDMSVTRMFFLFEHSVVFGHEIFEYIAKVIVS